jgi:penicillin-binding protein 2
MYAGFLTGPREFKNKRVKTKFKEDIEPQEVLLDVLAKKKEEELGISEKKFEVPLSRKILQGFLIISLILIFLLFGKTFQLQLVEHKSLSVLAEGNKFKIYQIQAERGVIYDRNYNQLVYNQPGFDLFLEIGNLPESEEEKLRILKEVSSILKKDVEELKREIENSESGEILIQKNLDYLPLILLETKINSAELPGFQIKRNFVRVYNPDFSHLIGYTGKISSEELKAEPEEYSIFDWVGKSGLEKTYEKILRRNPGKIRIEKDALGNLISQEIIKLPEPGKSLVLWLDSELQKKIKEELEKEFQAIGTQKGAAVALDPKTGGVLALVSLPSFDNNLFQKGGDEIALKKLLEDPQKPLFNRAISGKYLTGSTIKPLIAAAALEEKIINPNKKINDDKGFITIPNPWNPSLATIKKDWAIHGWTDMRKAIAESCNVYFYTIGGGYGDQEGLGPTRIKKYLELFGWNEITGIDLPEEAEGFIPDKDWKKKKFGEAWWDGDTYNLSIGQGFLQITPLEVATSFSAIANGGKLFQPRVVQKIVDSEKNVIQEFQPKIIRQNFIDPQNLQVVREGMRQAVTGVNSPQASAVLLNSLPVPAAAKTGTAELGNNYYHNWITVFAPYEDPQIVLTIVIENVKGIQAAALPVAKAVLEWYFSR